MVGQVISHYQIIQKLGQGGMGEVYLAQDLKLNRKVAIKFLLAKAADNDNSGRRLLREAQAVAMLDHPNICTIHEIGEEAGGHFIVMQYVEGETLAARLRKGSLSLQFTINIAVQVAKALSEAHAHGVVHRDIKPHNIILTPRDQVKVLDFGLAKIKENWEAVDSEDKTSSMFTRPGVILGTYAYMSPEQACGMQTDARSDLFSLGTVLYECVTGNRPFVGANAMETCAQVIHVVPRTPAECNPLVPLGLDRLIMKALSKKPEDRQQSADELITELETLNTLLDSDANLKTEFHVIKSDLSTSEHGTLSTISNSLLRPRRTTAVILGFVAVASLVYWGRSFFSRPVHVPPPEARSSYKKGITALRGGTFYRATKLLDQAVKFDDKFALAHAHLAEAWTELDYSDNAKSELLLALAPPNDGTSLSTLETLYVQAINLILTHDFSGAIEKYLKIVNQVPEDDKASAYFDLGRAYEKNEDLARALDSYQQAIKFDPQCTAAFLRLGVLYGRIQRFTESDAAFNKAEAQYQSDSDIEGVTEVLFQRGSLLNLLDKTAQAVVPLDKALKLTETTGSKYQQIRILLQQSSIQCAQGKTGEAQRTAAEAMTLARDEKIETLAAAGLIDIGNAFFSRGDYDLSESYFKQAIVFAQRNKGRRNEARAKLSLGSLYVQKGAIDDALPFIMDAFAFYEQGGYRKESSQATILLGRVHRRKGDYDRALLVFQRQLLLDEKAGDQSQVASSCASIAVLLNNQEQYSEALKYIDRSLKINTSLGSVLNRGYDLMNRGLALFQLGQYDQARDSLKQAAEIADAPEGNKQLGAEIFLRYAGLALSQRQFQEARTAGQQVLDRSDAGARENPAQAKSIMGLAVSLSGSPNVGIPMCQAAVGSARSAQSPRLLSIALLALAEALIDSGKPAEALNFAAETQSIAAKSKQQETEWRACLVAARAQSSGGDKTAARESGTRANNLLQGLKDRWGDENFKQYLARPDVQYLSKALRELAVPNMKVRYSTKETNSHGKFTE